MLQFASTALRIAPRAVLPIVAALAVSACGTFSRGGDDDTAQRDERDPERIALVALDQTLSVDPALGESAITLPPPVTLARWNSAGGRPNNVIGHAGWTEDPKRAWRRSVGQGSSRKSRVSSPPIVAGGVVYAMDGSDQVRAFDTERGKQIWRIRFDAPSKRDREARGGGLAFADGQLFATTGFGYISALDSATGEEAWRRELSGPLHSPPTADGGRVFAVTIDNELFALDAATGAVLWTYQSLSEPARVLTTRAPAVQGDVVIAPFSSGEVVALRAENGRELWNTGLARQGGGNTALSALNDVAGSPVLAGDYVFAVSHSGSLSALNANTGERIWSQPAGGVNTPWLAGEYLFVVTNEAEVAAVSARDGRVAWIRQLERYKNPKKRAGRVAWTGPVLAGGRLVLTNSEGDMLLLSPEDGSTVGEQRIGDAVFVPPVVAEDTVFVLTDDASLVALR